MYQQTDTDTYRTHTGVAQGEKTENAMPAGTCEGEGGTTRRRAGNGQVALLTYWLTQPSAWCADRQAGPVPYLPTVRRRQPLTFIWRPTTCLAAGQKRCPR